MKVVQTNRQMPTRLASLLEHTLKPYHIELHKRSKCGPFCRVERALKSLPEVGHCLVSDGCEPVAVNCYDYLIWWSVASHHQSHGRHSRLFSRVYTIIKCHHTQTACVICLEHAEIPRYIIYVMYLQALLSGFNRRMRILPSLTILVASLVPPRPLLSGNSQLRLCTRFVEFCRRFRFFLLAGHVCSENTIYH
jgi:hypothetical protein